MRKRERHFTPEDLARLQGIEGGPEAAPSVRGWLLGLLSCALLAAVIPYIDMVIRMTRLTLNLLAASSIVLTFSFALLFNFALARWKQFLRLSRQDLALIFCMTMLINAIPGNGFMNFLVNMQMTLSYGAREENRWAELVFPHFPEELAARDPYRMDPPARACASGDVGGVFSAEHREGAAGDGDRAPARLTGAAMTVDAVALAKGDRVLLVRQNDARQNGLYVVTDAPAGGLVRAGDADRDHRVRRGMYMQILEGRENAGWFYILRTPGRVRLNETALHFERIREEKELPRPAEWFYTGLPAGPAAGAWDKFRRMPWGALAGPYARWCLATALVLIVFFSAAGILHRQWSERERLPFPLAQVPDGLLSGLGAAGQAAGRRPFLRDPRAWWGIGITFALLSYNALGDHVSGWAPLPLRTDLRGYFTEPPWRHLTPMIVTWCPSMIGLMYLVSTEVSFSLWFFYIVVFKVGLLIAILGWSMGESGWAGPGLALFENWGCGALIAMVLAGSFMARSHLWRSLKQALGVAAADGAVESLPPRMLWLLLGLGMVGAAAWLAWYGVPWYWAVLAVLLLLLTAVGVARVVCEAGVVFIQSGATPVHLLSSVFTPAALGPSALVLLTVWERVMFFSAFRMTPVTNIINALHLGGLVRMRLRPLVCGMAAAVIVVFSVCFFSYHYTLYTAPGGARGRGWSFNRDLGGYEENARSIERMKAYQAKVADAVQRGRPLRASDVPQEARRNWPVLTWLAIGAAVMSVFIFLRTRVFWWPHPVGMVMWMSMYPLHTMWFSYFVGWLAKLLLVKFGGQRAYTFWRPFFIGVIVGEALTTIFWIAAAWLRGISDGRFKIEYN